jgi:hypothetical protein
VTVEMMSVRSPLSAEMLQSSLQRQRWTFHLSLQSWGMPPTLWHSLLLKGITWEGKPVRPPTGGFQEHTGEGKTVSFVASGGQVPGLAVPPSPAAKPVSSQPTSG